MTVACDDMDLDFGGGQRYETPFHYAYDVQPGGRLNLETFNGSVEVRSWDQNKVDISGTKYANSTALRDAIKIEASATPGLVSVRAVRPPEHHGSMGVKFVVRVPRDITLDRVTSSNGGVKVESVNGAVHAHTSNGGVQLTQVHGDMDVTTSNGGIELNDATGNMVLRTSNGHIQAEHVSGPVSADSSNGSITIAFNVPPKNDVHASTSNSSIEVSMPDASAVRVRANTSNGSISSDWDLSAQGEKTKNHLEGSIHGGGALLDLETSNGSIKLVKP